MSVQKTNIFRKTMKTIIQLNHKGKNMEEV